MTRPEFLKFNQKNLHNRNFDKFNQKNFDYKKTTKNLFKFVSS